MSTKPKTAAEKIAELAERVKGSAGEKTEKLKKSKYQKKGGNGGARGGSGRKTKEETLIARGIKQWVDNHVNESVEVEITDKKTGKTIRVKKPRVAVALEKLFKIGVQGEGNVDALNKWLDRAVGKPLQPIGGDDEKPIVLKIDF